jgi:LuxR family maltose regulon positive regulatory protein
LLDQQRQTAQTKGQTWELIRALILLALAYNVQGNEAQALNTLQQQALTLAQPLGLSRTFVDEGAAMVALLRKSASRNIAPDYVAQLLDAFGEDTPGQQSYPGPGQS